MINSPHVNEDEDVFSDFSDKVVHSVNVSVQAESTNMLNDDSNERNQMPSETDKFVGFSQESQGFVSFNSNGRNIFTNNLTEVEFIPPEWSDNEQKVYTSSDLPLMGIDSEKNPHSITLHPDYADGKKLVFIVDLKAVKKAEATGEASEKT